ncbi:gamma-glutamyl hydrolase-like [Mya arenaria]|uniref:gamma-glutamyl hydrolase-like n=1 Tax=Mya arenaria TaxID=6604 RepID=UPI0022DF25EF|nr:gamma-glutamyl hydrolase-like [Mya arenaria]
MKLLSIIGLLVLIFQVDLADLNYRPIIGVLAQESSQSSVKYGDTFIPADYFQYIEMGGARGVPVFVDREIEYYEHLMNSINGVLFPGGGVSLTTSKMARAARIIYKLAIQANNAGRYFPLWGTCMGFQLLTVLTAGQNLMTNASVWDKALPLNFVNGYKSSRLYGSLPADVYNYLSTLNVTENFHNYGITPETMSLNKNLKNFYNVLSTNVDIYGKIFVSSFEGKQYPFYGVQFHPEKVSFLWNMHYHINHGPEAVRVGEYFANFLVGEARKSTNHFTNQTEEIASMIANYKPRFFKDATFELEYFFNLTQS